MKTASICLALTIWAAAMVCLLSLTAAAEKTPQAPVQNKLDATEPSSKLKRPPSTHVDFVYRGTKYRLSIAIAHTTAMEPANLTVRTTANGALLKQNPATGLYDLPVHQTPSKGTLNFHVNAYGGDKLKLLPGNSSQGEGSSGLKGWNAAINMSTKPPVGTIAKREMKVTLVAEYRLLSVNPNAGNERRELKSVALPLSWNVKMDPQIPGSIECEFLGTTDIDRNERGGEQDAGGKRE